MASDSLTSILIVTFGVVILYTYSLDNKVTKLSRHIDHLKSMIYEMHENLERDSQTYADKTQGAAPKLKPVNDVRKKAPKL